MATNTRKLAALLGASGTGIADAGTINTAGITADAIDNTKIADNAINDENIAAGQVVADIADDAITGAKFANDIAISTTGNIATTGSGTITSAGNLKVDTIKDVSGTKTLVTQDGSNWAWGTGVPTGTVVGHTAIQFHEATTLQSSGSLSELDTDVRLTYTAKSTSNKLLFQVSAFFVSPNSTQLSWSTIYNVTDSAYVGQPVAAGSRQRVHWGKRTSNYDANDHDMMNYLVYANAPSGAKTYTIYHGTSGKTDHFYMGSVLNDPVAATAPIVWSITEIQQ